MLNLSQLEAFVAIVDSQGFHEAAVRLGCSQSTVSQQLRKLEEFLGVTLITRDRTQSMPTVHGARLVPLARSVLRAVARARDVVAAKRIVIGASSNIGTYFLQPFVAAFTRDVKPPLEVDLRIATNPQIADALSAGEVDVGVMEWWDKREGFIAKKWRREELVVIVAPTHPWAKGKSVQQADLFSQPMIGGESGTGTGILLQKIFGKNASKIRVSLNVGSTEAVKSAVKAGLGISLVFASAVEEEVKARSLCALRVSGISITKDLFVIIPEQLTADSAANRFVQTLMG